MDAYGSHQLLLFVNYRVVEEWRPQSAEHCPLEKPQEKWASDIRVGVISGGQLDAVKHDEWFRSQCHNKHNNTQMQKVMED